VIYYCVPSAERPNVKWRSVPTAEGQAYLEYGVKYEHLVRKPDYRTALLEQQACTLSMELRRAYGMITELSTQLARQGETLHNLINVVQQMRDPFGLQEQPEDPLRGITRN
jgi:hypothetical protein